MAQAMIITPDLQTRESVMAAAGRVQFAVRDLVTDQVRYVKVEAKRAKPQGQGYERGTVPLDEATHVFISEKGYGTPRIGTYYPPKKGYDTGRFFPANDADPAFVTAMQIVVNHVNGIAAPEGLQVTAESRCGLCGHKLEDPESVTRGIGPECAQKPTGMKILHSSKFGQQPLPLDEAPAPADEPEDMEWSEFNLTLGEARKLRSALSCYIGETDGDEMSRSLHQRLGEWLAQRGAHARDSLSSPPARDRPRDHDGFGAVACPRKYK